MVEEGGDVIRAGAPAKRSKSELEAGMDDVVGGGLAGVPSGRGRGVDILREGLGTGMRLDCRKTGRPGT